MNEKIDILTNTQNAYSLVLQAHKRLNKQIDDMNNKIVETMDRNQSQFLVAYQNHIRKIKIQLNQIKSKADAQEKQLNQNDRVAYLEKQTTIFRQEALRLYDRLQQKTQEAQIYKFKTKQLQKTVIITQKQLREYMKQRKNIQAKLTQAQNKIIQLEQQIKIKDQIIARKTTHSSQSHTNNKNLFLNNLQSKLKQSKQKQISANKTISFGFGRRTNGWSANREQNKVADGQLKDWFLQCIRTIKRDVAQRKNVNEQLNFDYIRSIQQFKMVDRLRLLQKFMQNQKLLVWMYQKIFPTRISQISEYLSNKNIQDNSTKKGSRNSQHLLKQVQMLQDLHEDLQLPKVIQVKSRKSQIRNRIAIRDGKLNITTQ